MFFSRIKNEKINEVYHEVKTVCISKLTQFFFVCFYPQQCVEIVYKWTAHFIQTSALILTNRSDLTSIY